MRKSLQREVASCIIWVTCFCCQRQLSEKFIRKMHETPIGGHSGFLKTLQRLKSIVYWKHMSKEVKDFIKTCDTCQRCKSHTTSPAGLLQPLPTPEMVWEEVSTDFIESLHLTRLFSYFSGG